MKVLVLSPHAEQIAATLRSTGEEVLVVGGRISAAEVRAFGARMIISYSYPYFITDEIIAAVEGNVFDLHISFLPWNRGADPHFWSFFDSTPKGVSIYRVLSSNQEGELLAQRQVVFPESETLSGSHKRLHREIEILFADVWPDLRLGRLAPIPQCTHGSFHHLSDKDLFFAMLRDGWDSPVHAVEALGRRFRGQPPAAPALAQRVGTSG